MSENTMKVEDLLFDTYSTNYLDEEKFKQFLWGLMKIEPFTCDKGRPPMSLDSYITLFRILYGCGLRVTEGLNLIKEDFDLEHRILTIWYPKTSKMGKQKTTILPRDVPMLQRFLKDYSNSDQLFPVNRQNVWRYAKDAGKLAGLDIFEEHEDNSIEGVWTHLFRKSCAKNMRAKGAPIEMVSLKLRHKVHSGSAWGASVTFTYTRIDINALLHWEAKHFAS